MIGVGEMLLLILLLAVLFVGHKQAPKLAKALGLSTRIYKKAQKGAYDKELKEMEEMEEEE